MQVFVCFKRLCISGWVIWVVRGYGFDGFLNSVLFLQENVFLRYSTKKGLLNGYVSSFTWILTLQWVISVIIWWGLMVLIFNFFTKMCSWDILQKWLVEHESYSFLWKDLSHQDVPNLRGNIIGFRCLCHTSFGTITLTEPSVKVQYVMLGCYMYSLLLMILCLFLDNSGSPSIVEQ